MSQTSLAQQIRRLAALAQSGQAWDDSVPRQLAEEYQGWLEAAEGSSQPHLLLQRLANYCDEMQRLRNEAGRLLSYPRLVLAYLALLLLGLGSSLVLLGSPLIFKVVLSLLFGLTLSAYLASGNPELAWSWLGHKGRGRFEQLLWCSHLSQMLKLDLDLGRACHWAALSLREPGLRAQALALEERLLAGDTLAQALAPCRWDPLIGWAAEAASTHEALPRALGEAARTLEENLQEDISYTLAWLQPVALSVVGGLILLTLGTFWLNYQNLCLEAAR